MPFYEDWKKGVQNEFLLCSKNYLSEHKEMISPMYIFKALIQIRLFFKESCGSHQTQSDPKFRLPKTKSNGFTKKERKSRNHKCVQNNCVFWMCHTNDHIIFLLKFNNIHPSEYLHNQYIQTCVNYNKHYINHIH